MAVVTKETLRTIAGHFHEDKPGDPCFRCGEPLTLPYVMWAGVTKQIALHPGCAQLLSANLLADGLRAEPLPGDPPEAG